MSDYYTKCKQCGKRLKDPADKPIYVVRTDEYFCSQKCLTKNASITTANIVGIEPEKEAERE